jgi:lantibiotic biosynthesis protein
MTDKYSFHQNLVLRTPRYPFSTRPFDNSIINDNSFLESLYLASPVLTDEIIKLSGKVITDKKMNLSLNKYWLRAGTRCTPFGLFSGCNVAEWSDTETGVQFNEEIIKRHSRLDMHYACSLAQHLSSLQCIKSYLTFYPNNSLYLLGDELRYVEYQYNGGRRKHQISSVLSSVYLNNLLQNAGNGITVAAMKSLLTNDDITDEEAEEFINELLEAQVLVSELEPAITGKEFIYQIIDCLKTIYTRNSDDELKRIIIVLEKADALIKRIDEKQVNHPDEYQVIQNLLKELEVPFEINKLFQTDTIKIADKAYISADLQKDLAQALQVLNRLTPGPSHINLESFATSFTGRYENKEISLLEVLDTETGLGYPEKSGNDTTPLLDNVHLPQVKETSSRIEWGLIENLLNEKLNTAHKNGSFAIELTDIDIQSLNASNWDNLPPSMSVMFRLLSGPQNIFIEGVTGSSAANLLGRFAHADEAIEEMVKDITSKEQTCNPDIIFAEIIHLPESRIGNILLHPQFRKYEIPYLAKSSVTKECQIDVSDLTVSVKNKQIILRSKKLNKIIIPRLSTAHNYSLSALPVYHFLCDLQHQNHRSGLHFNWGSLAARFHFLPRVTYKNIILSAATWRFSQKYYKHIIDDNTNALAEKINAFRNQWQLPALVVLAEGDNELLINLEDHLSIDMLKDAIRNKPGIELKEFLLPHETAVTDRHRKNYCNQFVTVLIKKTASYHSQLYTQVKATQEIERSFTPGSSWLYYKFYCGPKSADKILSEAILPVTKELQIKGLIDKFFFIRYNDPSFHLRVRFQLSNTANLGNTMELVYSKMNIFEKHGFIWKTQLDTYQRELERYGTDAIEISEMIFFYDSIAVLKMLDITGGDEREHIRWLWAMRAIDSLLDDFEFSINQKINLADFLKTSFLQEFNADKLLKIQLNNKYNDNRKLIEYTLDRKNDAGSEMKSLLDILTEKSESIKPLADVLIARQQNNSLLLSLPNLLNSYIHMLVNRTSLAKPRFHELVIYDMLYRYYFSIKARSANIVQGKKILSLEHK